MMPDPAFLEFMSHNEKLLTYSTRQQLLLEKLNEHYSQQLDIIWENKEVLAELGLLDGLMGNVRELVDLGAQQSEAARLMADEILAYLERWKRVIPA